MAKKTKRKKVSKTAGATERKRSLDTVPTDELAREMARRRREIDRLRRRRDTLVRQVQEIDDQLRQVGAAIEDGGVRRRPRNEMSLADALASVLKNKTMSVTEAAEAVQNAGYRTTSSSFRTIVNQTLLKDPRFQKVDRGRYRAA